MLIVHLEFDSVVILDKKGVVKFLAPYNGEILGTNLSGLPFYSKVVKYGQPYWSSTFISPQTGKPTIAVAIPAGDGMIVGYLSLAALNAVTDMIHAGSYTYAMVIDRENTVIAHPNRNKVSERQNMGYLTSERQGNYPIEGSFVFRENGKENLASISLVPKVEWKVLVSVPAKEAYAPVERIKNMFAVGGLLAVLTAVVIAFFSLRKATKPLSKLVMDAKKIADADYSFESIPASYREIDELVANFYKMASTIQSREEALRNSKQNLQSFFDAVHESMVIIDREGTVLLSNAVGAERLGRSVDELVGACLYDCFPTDVAKFRREQYEKVFDAAKPVYFQDNRADRHFEQYCYPVFGDGKNMAGIATFAHDITERRKAEERIKSSLKEKEIMLKEIHHRVKNNLTIISSILALQSHYVKDSKSLEIFRECENRVRTMAMIHTKLYQSKEMANINFASYIKELANDLFTSYRINPDVVSVSINTEEISLDINTAIPVGLLLNELLSNALKYAFPIQENRNGEEKIGAMEGERRGEIIVTMREERTGETERRRNGEEKEDISDTPTRRHAGTVIILTVSDNGIGFPEGIDFRNTESLGLQLVMALVDQLDADIELIRDRGTTFIISFGGTG